jgi:hypothetical protein
MTTSVVGSDLISLSYSSSSIGSKLEVLALRVEMLLFLLPLDEDNCLFICEVTIS